MADDAFTPRTTVDDSQFQGVINVYTTKRTVSVQTPLPAVGSTVDAKWGLFPNHVVIARGSTPHGNNHKDIWIQHIAVPATFDEQDAYNLTKPGGDSVSRFYTMRRSDYQSSGYQSSIPPAGTQDTFLPAYVFAYETMSRIGSDPNSFMVAVERIYLLSPRVEEIHDDELDTVVPTTTVVIPRHSGTGSTIPGRVIEIQSGSHHHDLRVTQQTASLEHPRQLPSIIVDIPYRFPPLLRSARLVASWALAASSGAAPSYDEAWYIDYDLIEPTTGPYEARILRFLVGDPDSLCGRFPIEKIVTVRETIGVSRAWFIASDLGNSTFAEARQLEVPECIHDDIEIENADTLSFGQNKTSLPATPNFSAFASRSSMIVGYESSKTRYGLYLVEVTELNCTGVYNGQTVPFGAGGGGSQGGDTGAFDPPAVGSRPPAPTATVSADNATVTGTTVAHAEVLVRNGHLIVGRAMADGEGNYSAAISPIYTQPTPLSVVARRGGISSLPTPVTTNDLAPGTPMAAIASDLTTLTGTAQPGATIHILRNAVPQVEELSVPTNHRQVETLAFAGTVSADGDVQIVVTSAAVVGSPKIITFPVLTGDSPEQAAGIAKNTLEGDSAIAAAWAFEVVGNNLVATRRAVAANDATAELAMTDPNTTGITPATSTNTVAGNALAAITVAGTAILTVMSGIAPWSPLAIPFAVTTSDSMSNVAAKAAAALAASQANDLYIPTASGVDLQIAARTVAVHDPLLNLALTNGTCAGLVPVLDSTDSTPGGTVHTTAANSAGAFSYAFAPALSSGTLVQVTASDPGGTSPALLLQASATPPTLASAAFGTHSTITGAASSGAKVIAYVAGSEIGTAVAAIGGSYTITLPKGLIRGEVVQVVAVQVGAEAIRSSVITITAATITLEKPVYTETSAGYVGVIPAGATDIVIYPEADPGDESFGTVHTNGNFIFTLPDNLGENGERWAVVARYPEGDSDPIWFYAPVVNLGPVKFELYYVASRPGGELSPLHLRFFHFVWIRAVRPGMVLTLSFPGSDRNDIVIPAADFEDFTIPAIPPQYPAYRGQAEFPRFGVMIPFHDEAIIIPTLEGPIPIPLVVATVSVPDGRVYTATSDRGTWKASGKHSSSSWNQSPGGLTPWGVIHRDSNDYASTWEWMEDYP